ncbi:MAG TPA: hypothetical protein GX517_02205 [Alicyclobacillus sp.]|nr:hypothetical protein [Alicyclobacillus sp.]
MNACLVEENRLKEIEERVRKSTDGDWRSIGRRLDLPGVEVIVAGDYVDEGEPDLIVEVSCSEDVSADADLIAHAREDILWLLKTVRRLQEEIGKLRNAATGRESAALPE